MNRRHFVMGSALAAQATFGQTPGDRVGTAMIGTGSRGSGVLQGILQQPNARVTALCDINAGRLDKAASSAAKDSPATTADWHKILERKDVEAVFIETPPYWHAEMAIAALKAGKHVYCEKPIGLTPASIREIIKAAKSTNKVFLSGQQLRSVRHLAESVQKIHDGAIGDVLFIKAQRHATGDVPQDSSTAEWYFDVKKSGGYLVEQSVHNLDLCNWVMKAHPLRASGFGGIVLRKNEPAGRNIMDHSSITFDYPKGVRMSFTQLVFHPRSMPNGGQYIYVYGSKGTVDLMGTSNFYPSDPQGQASLLVPRETEDPHAHLTAFYNCIQKGAASPADVTVGATAALTAILGTEACTREKVVSWSDLGVEI